MVEANVHQQISRHNPPKCDINIANIIQCEKERNFNMPQDIFYTKPVVLGLWVMIPLANLYL